jgi:DNA-binding CsgD family transcriptional regulator
MDQLLRRPVELTQTQLKLLALVSSGYSLADAGRSMHFSRSHAYNEIQRVKSELGVVSLPALCMRAHALGLLSHPTGADMSVVMLIAA